jgi:hypothetical protein
MILIPLLRKKSMRRLAKSATTMVTKNTYLSSSGSREKMQYLRRPKFQSAAPAIRWGGFGTCVQSKAATQRIGSPDPAPPQQTGKRYQDGQTRIYRQRSQYLRPHHSSRVGMTHNGLTWIYHSLTRTTLFQSRRFFTNRDMSQDDPTRKAYAVPTRPSSSPAASLRTRTCRKMDQLGYDAPGPTRPLPRLAAPLRTGSWLEDAPTRIRYRDPDGSHNITSSTSGKLVP